MLKDFFPTKGLSKSATFSLLLLSLFLLLTGNVFAQKGDASVSGLARGQAAIDKLGDRLPAVALRNGKSPSDLRRLFLQDLTLYVDDTDMLFYIDDAPEKAEKFDEDAPSPPPAGPFPYSETFSLHSRAGSNRVIYLDFNGHVTAGTAWNTTFTNGQPINSAPFSIDGDPNSFSQQEQDVIQYIWQRVAEDYAPFDVDVTTQDPGVDAIIRSSGSDLQYGSRAVISPTSFAGGGGIAFVGSFNQIGTSFQPAFVFSAIHGNSEKTMAEAISHEVGHNLNLYHDGTASSEYYNGHGDWSPIMGVANFRTVTQWSRGEYPGANNQEDDLAIMQTYGISLIADDSGNTTATATVLNGTNINVSGLITTRSDVDVFQFSTGGGNVTLNLNPAQRGANLNIEAKILDAQSNVIATSNPAGLSAGFNQTLSAGVYYLTVDGVGAGDLSTGYSDYASIGQYSITGTVTAGNGEPPVAVAGANVTSGFAPLTVNFSSQGSFDPDGTIVSYAWNFGDGTNSTAPNPVKVYNSAGSFTAVLTVTDNSGLTDTESVVITVNSSGIVCTPFTTVTEGDLFPGGIVSFGVSSGPGSVIIDHVNAGTGMQSLTVVSATNATVNIPAYTPGTYTPVTVTFTAINPALAVDYTLRTASTFHAANIRVRCLQQ